MQAVQDAYRIARGQYLIYGLLRSAVSTLTPRSVHHIQIIETSVTLKHSLHTVLSQCDKTWLSLFARLSRFRSSVIQTRNRVACRSFCITDGVAALGTNLCSCYTEQASPTHDVSRRQHDCVPGSWLDRGLGQHGSKADRKMHHDSRLWLAPG